MRDPLDGAQVVGMQDGPARSLGPPPLLPAGFRVSAMNLRKCRKFMAETGQPRPDRQVLALVPRRVVLGEYGRMAEAISGHGWTR